MKTTASRCVLKPLAIRDLIQHTSKLTRTSDPLYSIEKDKFLTTYANGDAYGLMDRYLSFTRAADGTINGFAMDADPIRGIGFEKK